MAVKVGVLDGVPGIFFCSRLALLECEMVLWVEDLALRR